MKRWEYDKQMAEYEAEFKKLREWKIATIRRNLKQARRNKWLTVMAFGMALTALAAAAAAWGWMLLGWL